MARSGRLSPVEPLAGAHTTLYLLRSLFLPLLATEAPTFAEGFLGIFTGSASEINFGVLAALWTLSSVLLLLGGLVFGIATFRAHVLPRWPAGLLAVAAALTPAAALLPHAIQPLVAVPIGVGLAWLGYALWSERRREQAADPDDGVLTGVEQPAAVVPSNGHVTSKV